MKKVFFLLFASATMLAACGPKNELQECKGVVKTFYPDSVLVADIDGDEVEFEASDMQMNNGAIMAKDSVTIHFIGRLSGKCKALLVTLIPQQHVVDAVFDASKELETKEVDVQPAADAAEPAGE